MADIKFSSKETHERFLECKRATEALGDQSLMRCIGSLMGWQNPIVIGRDHDPMSFTFREELPQELQDKGIRGVCGGIIYHGPRDGYGSGEGHTHSVTLDKTEGYSIHT